MLRLSGVDSHETRAGFGGMRIVHLFRQWSSIMTSTKTLHPVNIYTDGGCSPNPGLGGYAAILVSGKHRKIITGAEENTTNYRMELMAAVVGLEALTKPAQVRLVADNNNVVRGANEWLTGWKDNNWQNSRNQEIAHRDLWQRVHAAMQIHDVTFVKVKAHVADSQASDAEAMNNQADALVAQARDNYSPDADDTPEQTDDNPEPSDDTPRRSYRLYIAGSRRVSPNMLEYARRIVARAIETGWTIVVGDNHRGIDNEVVREANRLHYSDVIVVGIARKPRNGGVSGGKYIRYGTRYKDRDRAMGRASDRGVFIWDGRSRGTRQGHAYMTACQKTTHLVDFSRTFQTV
jgi:ribonuclease HI